MRKNLTLALGLAAATVLGPQLAMAAPVTSGDHMSARPLVEGVRDDHDGRGNWHRRDEVRRDFDGPRFGRWHRFNRCRFVRHACADRFDWGSWRYQRCVWHRGC